jgi:ketosteroid isomerase-like protein
MILALVLISSSAAAADLTETVRCREIGFSIAAENRDAEAFASFVDADARFVGASVTRGTEEITQAWNTFLTVGGPAIKWRPQVIEVLEDGMLALSRGPYRMVTTDDEGNETEHWGTFNSVWRLNDDGEWRVVFDAGNAAAEPPGEEIQALLDLDVACEK